MAEEKRIIPIEQGRGRYVDKVGTSIPGMGRTPGAYNVRMDIPLKSHETLPIAVQRDLRAKGKTSGGSYVDVTGSTVPAMGVPKSPVNVLMSDAQIKFFMTTPTGRGEIIKDTKKDRAAALAIKDGVFTPHIVEKTIRAEERRRVPAPPPVAPPVEKPPEYLALKRRREFERMERARRAGKAPIPGVLPPPEEALAPPGAVEMELPPEKVTALEIERREAAAFTVALKKQPPELQKAYKVGGVEAYNKAVEKIRAHIAATHIQLPGAQWVPLESKKDKKGDIIQIGWNDLPEKFQTIGLRQGFSAMDKAIKADIKEFETSHIQLPDGKFVLIKAWNELPSRYQTIGLRQGFGAIERAIKADEAKQKTIVATLDARYQVDGGYNLPLAIRDKAVTEADLEFIGFKKPDISAAVETVKVSEATRVEVAGGRKWEDSRTGKIYTDRQRRELIEKSPQKQDELVLTHASGNRLGIEVLSHIAPATRAALPEYKLTDISAVEWGLTGVNPALIAAAFAPSAILSSLAARGIVTGVATTGAGLYGYQTGKNWSKLTTAHRAIGVGGSLLYALPMLATVARGVKVSAVKIPVAKGQAAPMPVWKGLSVFKNPIIGKSGGKWVVGARNITLPEARLIVDGYKPEMMLDTKVFANPSALAKAGFSPTQIKYLSESLKARNLFAGKKAPYLSKDALIEPTAYIDGDEMAIFLKQIVKYNTKVKNVDMLYGGTTIKAQLAPELRGWRSVHDLDIHTSFQLDEATKFINETIKILKGLPGKRQYRVSPKSPLRIEKLVKGKWEHLNDLKSEHIDPKLQISEVPSSQLDKTGAYSYGRMVAEPVVTVNYPGIGKLDIMSLSESGVRKADTILRVRQIDKATAFRPPERGIAKPGVPKDAADYFVILQTYEKAGFLKAGTSEAWLKSWARAMGYTEAELTKLMPTLKKAMVEVASSTPSNLAGYRFTPASVAKVPAGASPTVIIHTPSSLGASVSGSLAKQISTPVSLYNLSPRARAIIASAIASIVPVTKPRAKPSPIPVPIPGVPRPSAVPVTKPKVKPSAVPSAVPVTKPSPIPSPVTIPKPSPVPTPITPSPVPVPVTDEPPPPPPPPPERFPRGASDKEKRKIIKKADGAIAWRHGELHGKDVFHVGIFPYEGKEYWDTVVGKKPAGATIVKGVGSAYQSAKLLYGKAPASKITGDLGFFDWSITPTGPRKVTIRFKPDPKMQTTGDITLGRRTPPITERRPTLTGRGKGFRITPRTPALRR